MPPAEFRRFLGSSLDRLASEVPDAYAELGRQLADLPLRVEVDGETTFVVFEAGRHGLLDDGEERALLRTSRHAIVELVEGRLSMREALEREALWLQGRPEALVLFDAALRTFLAGAVRAPAFPGLLHEYRRRAAPPQD